MWARFEIVLATAPYNVSVCFHVYMTITTNSSLWHSHFAAKQRWKIAFQLSSFLVEAQTYALSNFVFMQARTQ